MMMTREALAILFGELEAMLAQQYVLTEKRFNPDQPRAPAGSPEGGQWTSDGAEGGATGTPARVTGRRAPGADERVSTTVPSAKRQGFDPHQRQDLQPGIATFKQAMNNPKFREGVDKVLDRYGQSFLRLPAGATTDQKVEAFVEQSKSNIVALYNAQDKDIRERSKDWYVGANKIAGDMAREYGVSQRAAAGVMASLSPQRDWDQNVELARRVMDVAVKNKDQPFSGESAARARAAMVSYATRQTEEANSIEAELPKLTSRTEIQAANKKIENRREMAGLIDHLQRNFEGKRLSELPLDQQAVMVRFYDAGNAPSNRGYRIWNPDGTPSGKIARNNPTAAQRKRGEEGDPKQAGWGGFDSIGNSLSILRDDSTANISASLGDNHKVRNFYNNIISPNFGQDTTIDTHAVAASTLMPLGQSSPIVKEGLGMSGPKNAETGLKGMYALHYEAYRRAAADVSRQEGRTVLPREMQSASWEALRGLYTDVDKRDRRIIGQNSAIWEAYLSGEISLEAAQKRILERGIRRPRWA
jgi:hypothetical protein